MKKIYTLLFSVALAFGANAQTNLVANGGFETWTDATTPANFSPAPYTASVSQESTIVYEGTYSAKHVTGTSSSIKLQTEVSGIIPGHSYTISYRYLDNDVNARSRMWSFWLTSESVSITDGADVLRPSTYSEDNAAWQLYTVTLTAPATASIFRFETRSYSQNSAAGTIYYDNFKIVDNDNLSVNQNQIEGLKIYPNPVTNGTFYINTNADSTKEVVVYDVLGKQVIKTSTTNAVNVSNLKGGVYIVKITEDGKTATRKLVIK